MVHFKLTLNFFLLLNNYEFIIYVPYFNLIIKTFLMKFLQKMNFRLPFLSTQVKTNLLHIKNLFLRLGDFLLPQWGIH